MPPLTNMLISASAGTGKTYQLSLRFLGLLALNGGNHPERLIAITLSRRQRQMCIRDRHSPAKRRESSRTAF